MHLNSNDIPHVLHLELQLFPLCKSWVSGSLSSLIGMPNSDYAPINELVMSDYGTIIVYTCILAHWRWWSVQVLMNSSLDHQCPQLRRPPSLFPWVAGGEGEAGWEEEARKWGEAAGRQRRSTQACAANWCEYCVDVLVRVWVGGGGGGGGGGGNREI